MKLFYLGPGGSYSHIAATQWQARDRTLTLVPRKSFADTTGYLDKDSQAIVPVENSITSSVHDNVSSIFSGKYYIYGELFLKIGLHLFGFNEENIDRVKSVYSHPKALEQVSEFVTQHQWQTNPVDSTAAAAEQVLQSQDTTAAIVGSKLIPTYYPELKLLQENIGNSQTNYTRFLVLQTFPAKLFQSNHTKASVIMTLTHQPGSLAQVLTPLAEAEINLTKIESRPIEDKPWHYKFWIDIEAKNGTELKLGYDILQKQCQATKLLGTYSKANIYES